MPARWPLPGAGGPPRVLALVAGLGLLLAPALSGAEAPPRLEVHGLAALDGWLVTAPDLAGASDAQVAARGRLDVRHAAGGRLDFKLDFWGRLDLTQAHDDPIAATTLELRELWVALRDLGGRLDLTLGRLVAPGGFWLFADGARLDLRYGAGLSQAFFGGLRAFTTQRENADLDLRQPVALPLAGTSLCYHHALLDAALTFTWARDALDLPTTLGPNDERPQRDVVDELFLDLSLSAQPRPTLLLAGGASAGSRYDVQFQTPDPTAPVRLGVVTLGALAAWAMALWRPLPALRASYSINYERLRLVESNLPAAAGSGRPPRFTGGTFLDNGVQLAVLPWRAVRIEGQYRLRWREDTDLEHHAVLALQADDLWRGLGAFASVGVDVFVPVGASQTVRLLYAAGLSYRRERLDVGAGVLFTDGVGSGLLFSQATPTSSGGAPSQLFPYLLESNRIAFVRVFGSGPRGLFGGLDLEENLDGAQLRAMAQVGYAR